MQECLHKLFPCCFRINTEENSPQSCEKVSPKGIITMFEKEEFKETALLKLQIIDSEELEIGKEFKISQEGLVSSLRKHKDGCVYAGSKLSEEGKVLNDIVLSAKEKGVGDQHFQVKYNSDKSVFTLKDLGQGDGTFIRLDKPLLLQSNQIISFGDTHVSIQITNGDLRLRFIEGPMKDQV